VNSIPESDRNIYLDFGQLQTGTGPQYFDVDVNGPDVINYGTDAASLQIYDQGFQKVRRYRYGSGELLTLLMLRTRQSLSENWKRQSKSTRD
jgi:hypothetical protein